MVNVRGWVTISSMTGRTHDLAAATALVATAIVLQPTPVNLATALAALLANQIGGIAPDIDQPTAPFWRNLPIGGFFGRIFGKLLGGHRFLSHSLVGVVVFGLAARALINFLHPLMPHIDIGIVWVAFMIGVCSHLVMDSFTREGVPWLLPVPVKFGFPPVRSLRVTTGKKMEVILIFPLIALGLIWLCSTHYVLLQQLILRP
ncbi:MAG: Membrane protein containing transrane [Candidatus Saccharibacteria bacterium]|nr:Membrane protein containing transrane [Candidatus Saccharibacteria bacterium]